MSNYLMVDGNKIPISNETAENLRKQFAPTRYQMGDKFILSNGWKSKFEVMLVQIRLGIMKFIVLSDGNRFNEVEVTVNNPMRVTISEIDVLTNGYKYEKIEE